MSSESNTLGNDGLRADVPCGVARISSAFAAARNQGRAAYVQFICAGDPNLETSQSILDGLPDAGVDLIELGMPFSDPMADGPTIQRASQRSLANGHTMADTLAQVSRFRERNAHTPIILMGYCNPVFVRGYDEFVKQAAQSGVDGLLLVDLPMEESTHLRECVEKAGLALIPLVSPVTGAERMGAIAQLASGFIYYVSITGVTGTKVPDLSEVEAQVRILREYANLPVAIGFGVTSAEQVATMTKVGDAVVVGSAVVQAIEDSLAPSSEISDDDTNRSTRVVDAALRKVSSLVSGVRGSKVIDQVN